MQIFFFFFFFISVRLLSVLRGHSGFFIPATTANDLRHRRIFYPRCYPLHLFSYLNSWERASIFPFECSVLNKGTTGAIFITSLVWRGPWLEIEPGTSRTRSQHYTTRLSRRRWCKSNIQAYKYCQFRSFTYVALIVLFLSNRKVKQKNYVSYMVIY